MTASLPEMKRRAVQYLIGEDDLATFRDWFVMATADLDTEALSESMSHFVDAVDALLVRLGIGEITEKQLKRELTELASDAQVEVRAKVAEVAPGTVSEWHATRQDVKDLQSA